MIAIKRGTRSGLSVIAATLLVAVPDGLLSSGRALADSNQQVDLASFGTGSFVVDADATTAAYSQATNGIIFSNSYVLGDTLGGLFATQEDWSVYASSEFGIVLTLRVANPNLPFSVAFYDENSDIIHTYSGTTTGAAISTSTFIPLAPSLPGTADFSKVIGVQFTWDGSATVDCTLEKIAVAGGAPSPAPEITSSPTANGRVGRSFGYHIAASGWPTSFDASGLPAGLSVNTTNGLISGTPSKAGNFSVTISAGNPGTGTGSAQLALSIDRGTQAITFKPASVQRFRAGGKFTLSATATSKLRVSFRSSDPKILSISGRTATMKKRGKVFVTASKGGNADFLPAERVDRPIEIR